MTDQPLTFIIDHNCARYTAVMNACIREAREGRVWWDESARVHTTQDPEVVTRMRRLGAKVYPA